MLDVRLPDIDGHAVLSAIRRHENTPVIFLTVMAEELDRIVGLKLGGDGYVVKPASPAEIVARMDGVLRRSERAEPPAEYLRLGCLEVDLAAHGARVDGRGLALTPTEFRLLSHLAARPRRVFTRAELMGACLP